MKYAILDDSNIATNIYGYSQALNHKPANYIEVTDDLMLWHKFENDVWSVESFAPSPTPPEPTPLEILQNTCDLILLKQEGIL
jgi:hypothetical protein